MQRFAVTISFILLITIALTSCDFEHTGGYGGQKEDYPLVTLVSITVPGGNCNPYVIRKEEDSYGRILFEAEAPNAVARYYDGLKGIFICHKIADGYAYYDDANAYFICKRSEEYTEEQIDRLKELNDWDKPIDESKLTKVKSLTSRFDSTIIKMTSSEEENVKKAFLDLSRKTWYDKNSANSHKHTIEPSCKDADGRLFAYVILSPSYVNKNFLDDKELYAIILNPDGTYNETALLEIEDPFKAQTAIYEFKMKNGWVYQ